MGLFSPSLLHSSALLADHSPPPNPRYPSDCNRIGSNPRPLPRLRPGTATCHRWPRASHSEEPQLRKPPLHPPNSRKCRFDAAALSKVPSVGALAAVALICSGFGSPVSCVVSSELPIKYPCEDVARYYSGAERSEGAALMEKLGSIVSGQKSLKYKEVWEALKYLDAVSADDPETSMLTFI